MSEASEKAHKPPRHDLLTVAAIGLIVYAVANVLHEGVGHGGACLLVGGKPNFLSSLNFNGDAEGLPPSAHRLIAAGGTLVNFGAAFLALAALSRVRAASAHVRYFLWLAAIVNLFQATGYLLFSGASGIGDWAGVTGGLQPSWLWRIGLAVVGGVSYWLTMRTAMILLNPFLGGDGARRYRQALTLCLVPYLTGSALYILSGLFNPGGMALVAVSAVAASVGGTCGFIWSPFLLLGDDIPPSTEEAPPITRNWGWIAAAAILAALFIGVLGPGIRLG